MDLVCRTPALDERGCADEVLPDILLGKCPFPIFTTVEEAGTAGYPLR